MSATSQSSTCSCEAGDCTADMCVIMHILYSFVGAQASPSVLLRMLTKLSSSLRAGVSKKRLHETRLLPCWQGTCTTVRNGLAPNRGSAGDLATKRMSLGILRDATGREETPLATTETTGTRDVTYDLISLVYHALQAAETYQMYE